MSKIEKKLSELSVIIVSHILFEGHAQELENFLSKRCREVMFIGHPFSNATWKSSFVRIYKSGNLKFKIEGPEVKGPELFLFIKDFLLTFYFIFKYNKKFDIFIGLDPLNALAGILLKKIGIVRIVIFYVIDYVPIRFKNALLNGIYHFIDRFCVYHADYTWNLTASMIEARAKRGINKTNQMVVPTGTNYDRIKHLLGEEVDKTSIIFVSHLRKGQGIELILEAMPIVVKRIPTAKLIIIGTGPLEDYFRSEVKKRYLDKNIIFLGYKNHGEIEKIIPKCRVGIAPYVPDPNSFTWYADPSKPKVYLGCGVPVIITKVPEIAFEIEKRGAGIAINYDKHELANAIIKLLTDDELYRQCRKNALKFAAEYTWTNIFYNAFSQILSADS